MNAAGRVPKPLRKRQFGWLMKHFFGRFFDNELAISPQVKIRVTVIQTLVPLILPGLMLSMFLFQKYGYYAHQPVWARDLATLNDKYFFLSLTMILVGLFTILEWDALFPDRKDYSILTPLPIETRTVFAAKLAALLLFLLLFTLAVNACPIVLFPLGVLAKRTKLFQVLWYVCSHAASILAGNAFVFFTEVSL